MKAFGAPAAVLELTKPDRDYFEVWPENWDALQIFLRAQTQWVVGMNGALGLNYPSIEFLFRIYRSKKRRKLFESIQEIELGALEYQRNKERAGASGT